MPIEKIQNYPYPENLDTIDDIEDYLKRLRRVLLNQTVTMPEVIQATFMSFGDENDYLKQGANTIVGRTYAEVLGDLSGDAAATFDWNAQSITNIDNIAVLDESWVGIGAAAERIVFDSGGNISIMGANVGIGIDPPAFKHDVYGDINLTGYVYMDSAAWIQNPATRNSFIGEGVVETPGAAGTDDFLYLAYVYGDEIQKFSDALVYQDAVGSAGAGNGEFNNAHDVCSDATHFYTIETVNDRVQKFLCSDLSYIAKLGSGGSGNGQYSNAQGICTDDTYLYVADTSNHRIQKLNCSDLAYVAQIGSNGSGDNEFNSPESICTDGTYLYVSDTSNHRIKKHNCSDLAYVAKVGSIGSGDDQFSSPHGIGTDGTYVYVVDNNNRVNKRNCSDLAYVAKIGTTGSGDDQFSNPKRVTVDSIGARFFVSDDSNKRIVKRRCSDLGYIDEVAVAQVGSYGLGFSAEVDTDFIDNTIGGFNAGNVLSTGDRDTIYGAYAGDHLLGGKDDVFIGFESGNTATTAKQCIVIGSTADIGATNINSIVIGFGASVDANDTVYLGNASITAMTWPWFTTAGMVVNNGSGAITSLTDPGADRIAFWDDSETATAWLAVGNSIVITTTTVDTVQDIRTTASPTFAGLTISDGGSISLQEDISFTGATTENLIKMPDNLADALSIQEGANKYVTFITTDDEEDIVCYKSVDILHTAVGADEHALEIDADAANFGDVKAIAIDYITGSIAAGQDEGIILVNINEIAATGGDVFGLEVLATDGSAGIYGMKVGAVIGPIHQDSGTFANPTTGTDNTTSTDVPYMIDGLIANTTAIFENNSEYILIGAAAVFEEIEFIITTGASGAGIKPTFWYSTAGAHQFTQFTPVDGTGGFRHTGVVAWDASDLTSHGVNTDTSTYDIKVIRTRGNLSTSPVLGYAKTAATTEYIWDKDGDVNIHDLTCNALTPSSIVGWAIDLNVQAWDANLDTYADITPSLDIQTFLANADFAAMMADLSATAGATFDWNSRDLSGVGDIAVVNNSWIGIAFNAERIVFDTTGYVYVFGADFGVGTATPTDLLHVYYSQDSAEKGIKIESFAPSLKFIDLSGSSAADNYQILVNTDTFYLKHDAGGDGTYENTRLVLEADGDFNFQAGDIVTTGTLGCAALTSTGVVRANGGFSDGATAGIDTTFLDADGNTITVSGGLITAKTAP